MSDLVLEVTALDDSVSGVRSVRLAATDRAELPAYPAGSHLVLRIPAGPTRPRQLANAYSLTGDGVAPLDYRISVLRRDPADGGAGGSAWIHELAVGDAVSTDRPRTAFAPVLTARRHLLVSAGIGITPMIGHLRAAIRWSREVELVHVYRPGTGAHLDDIAALTEGSATLHHDRDALRADLQARLARQPIGTHLYLCGPTGFLDDVLTLATGLGWPSSRISVERFGIDALAPGEPFRVGLPDGRELAVPSGVSLLEALEDSGIEVPNLCRQGVCGECRLPASGDVLHRDLYLSDADRDGWIMPCVSRAAASADSPARIEVTV